MRAFLLLYCCIIIRAGHGAQFNYNAGDPSTHGDFEVQAAKPGDGSGSNISSGSSNFTPYIDSGKLWLTHFHEWDVGRIIYNRSVPFFPHNSTQSQVVSFNASLQFQILTSGATESGDGLAFFISPLHDLSSNTGGSVLALFPLSVPTLPHQFFAVEFDTFLNAEWLDISSSHIGIDIDSLKSVNYSDTTNSSLSLHRNSTLTAWIEYAGLTHQISVWASANGAPRPTTPTVTAIKDLSTIFMIDPNMYVGVSAASGMAVEGTALISFSFASEYIVSPREPPVFPLSPPSMGPAPFLLHSRLHSGPRPSVVAPLAGILAGAFLLLCLAGLIVGRKKLMGARGKLRDRLQTLIDNNTVPVHFDYRELKKATRGFSKTEKVGEGGFSSVYKGTLATGHIVAVKRLKEGLKMELEFASEIQIISRIRHRNLLQLQGWGYEAGEALLVYPFMANGSLDRYLFGKKREEGILDSHQKLNILIDAAAALEYLHGGLEECVLHRDVKAANVMLTEKYEAMLGDFGLARLVTHNQAVTTTVAGTPGYMAPEVVYTGRVTDKADVYSFGVLALEVACGRRRVLNRAAAGGPEEVYLVEWVWLLHERGKIMDALDVQVVEKNDGGRKWECVLHVGLLCCHPWRESRPSMREVHQALQESIVLPLPSTRPTIYIGPNHLPSSCKTSLDSQSATPF